MDFFFEPRGIAVVGATVEPYHGGQHLVTNLTLGYRGPIYPVNPKYSEVSGLKCYPKISDNGGPLNASASHTAFLAGNDDLIRGVLKQGGVHQADDFFEMVDIAREPTRLILEEEVGPTFLEIRRTVKVMASRPPGGAPCRRERGMEAEGRF